MADSTSLSILRQTPLTSEIATKEWANENFLPISASVGAGVSSIVMNGETKTAENNSIDIGTVLTAHQSLTAYTQLTVTNSLSNEVIDGISNVISPKLSTIANLVEDEVAKLDELSGKLNGYALTGHTHTSSDITNFPPIPTVNNGTLTIQKNGSTLTSFSANQSNAVTANISVPLSTSELTNDSGFATSSDLEGYLPLSGGTISGDLEVLANYGIGCLSGLGAHGRGFGGLAIGYGANAKGITNTGGTGTLAIGLNSSVNGNFGIAIGPDTTVSSNFSIGIGYQTNTNAGQSIAIGSAASTNATNGIAIGRNAESNNSYAIQLGYGKNTETSSFQVFDYKLLDSAGNVPEARVSAIGYIKSADIPTSLSDFTNDPGYLTSSDLDLAKVMEYQGTVETYADLPSSGLKKGYVYDVISAYEDNPPGTNYAWNGTRWDPLGGSIDASVFALKSDISGYLPLSGGEVNYLETAALTAPGIVADNKGTDICADYFKGSKVFIHGGTPHKGLSATGIDFGDGTYISSTSEFLTAHQSLSDLYNLSSELVEGLSNVVIPKLDVISGLVEEEVDKVDEISAVIENLAAVAYTGDYNDLSNLPEIPTAASLSGIFVDLSSNQEISGSKSFVDGLNVDGSFVQNTEFTKFIVSGSIPGITILNNFDENDNTSAVVANNGTFLYKRNGDKIYFTDEHIGKYICSSNTTYDYKYPNANGTLALYSQIPLSTSQLTNDSDFVTSQALTGFVDLSSNQNISGEKGFMDGLYVESRDNNRDIWIVGSFIQFSVGGGVTGMISSDSLSGVLFDDCNGNVFILPETNNSLAARRLVAKDQLANYIDKTTAQTITGKKTFNEGLVVNGSHDSNSDVDFSIFIVSGGIPGVTIIDNVEEFNTTSAFVGNNGIRFDKRNGDAICYHDEGVWKYTSSDNEVYDYEFPNASGMLALSSDIPTSLSDLTNDPGYITGYTETDPVFNNWLSGDSIAAGSGANITGDSGIAIGADSYTGIGTSFGTSSYSSNGVAIGKNAHAATGIAIGLSSYSSTAAIAIGREAYSKSGALTTASTAVGYKANALSSHTIAIGGMASADAISAIQIGRGINSTQKSLQVWEYPLLLSTGDIPEARVSAIGYAKERIIPALSVSYVNSASGSNTVSGALNQLFDEALWVDAQNKNLMLDESPVSALNLNGKAIATTEVLTNYVDISSNQAISGNKDFYGQVILDDDLWLYDVDGNTTDQRGTTIGRNHIVLMENMQGSMYGEISSASSIGLVFRNRNTDFALRVSGVPASAYNGFEVLATENYIKTQIKDTISNGLTAMPANLNTYDNLLSATQVMWNILTALAQ